MWFYRNQFPFFGTSSSVGPNSLSIRAMSGNRKDLMCVRRPCRRRPRPRRPCKLIPMCSTSHSHFTLS